MSKWEEIKEFLINRGEQDTKSKKFEVEQGRYLRTTPWKNFIFGTDIGKMIRENENIKFGDGIQYEGGFFIKLDEEKFAQITLERLKEDGTENVNVEIFGRDEVEERVHRAFYDPAQPEAYDSSRAKALLELKDFETDEKKIDKKVLRTKVYYSGDLNYERITSEELDWLLELIEEGDEAFYGRLPESFLEYAPFQQKVSEYLNNNPDSKVSEKISKQHKEVSIEGIADIAGKKSKYPAVKTITEDIANEINGNSGRDYKGIDEKS